MKSFLILGLGRKCAGLVGVMSLGFGAFSAWNTLQAKLPEYMNAVNEIQNSKEIGNHLDNQGEIVKERLRLKHFLVEEVLQKRIGWKEALGTYGWLCAQSQVRRGDLDLAPNHREGIEKLVDSFCEWAVVACENETGERMCRLLNSFEATEPGIDRVDPVFQPEILARFQLADNPGNP